jgi:hypothetical protein
MIKEGEPEGDGQAWPYSCGFMESSFAKEFNHASPLPIQDFRAMPRSAAGRLCLVDAASPP